MRLAWVLGSSLLIAAAGSTHATTLPVPSEYPTIQAAFGAAVFGDTVLVAPGTYSDVETRTIPWDGFGTWTTTSIVFLRDGVLLKSEAGPGLTVLDMGPVVPSGAPVAVVGSGPSSETVIEGFTILSGPHAPAWGVALDSESTDLTIRECRIQGFDARPLVGGGVVLAGPGHTLRIERSEIVECGGEGTGAVSLLNSDLVVIDTLFEENFSSGGGGAISVSGTSRAPLVNHVEISGCSFVGNDGGGKGGAFVHGATRAYASFSFVDCLFVGNTAAIGGAVSLETAEAATASFDRCVFSRNEAGRGGALTLTFGTFWVSECTFWGNRGHTEGGALYTTLEASTFVEESVVAASTGSEALFAQVALSATISTGCDVFWANTEGDVMGATLQETDRVADPMFCDEVTGDFTLRAGSPCLPENSAGCGQIGVYGVGCGTVSVTPTTFGRIKAAYRDGGQP